MSCIYIQISRETTIYDLGLHFIPVDNHTINAHQNGPIKKDDDVMLHDEGSKTYQSWLSK